MRILTILQEPDRPEAELLGALVERGHTVVSLSEPSSLRAQGMISRGVTVAPLTIRSRTDLRAIATIRAITNVYHPDVVHCFSARAVSVSALALIGKPVPLVAYRGTIGRLSRFDPLSWMSFLNPRVNHIIAVSEAVRLFLVQMGRRPESVTTIHKGHVPTWYQPNRSLRKDLGISDDALIISCVANARHAKGVDVLVDAFSALEISNTKLLLVGDMTEATLQRRLRSSKRAHDIIMTGFRSDAAALCGASDISVVPSREREGFPKSLLEAMFQGIPVVGSDVGGIPEIIEDQRSGVLVPPGNSARLCDALTRLCQNADERKRFGITGKERANEHFQIQSTIDKTEALYRELAPTSKV